MEKIQVGKLVGVSSLGQWSQVHTFSPRNGRKREKYGDLWLAVSVEGEEGQDLAAFGQEIIVRLHEQYYGSEVETVPDRLRAGVKEVVGEFEAVKLTVAAGVVRDEVLHVVIEGNGRVVLAREGELYQVKGGSGRLEGGDVVVLGTDDLFKLVGFEELKKGGGGEEIVERLAPKLAQGSGAAGAAGVVGKVEEGDDQVVSEVEAETEIGGLQPRIARTYNHGLHELKRGCVDKLRQVFSGLRLGGRQGVRGLYVGDEIKRKRRVRVVAAVVLGGLLIVSVVLGWRKREVGRAEKAFAEVKSQVERQMEQGQELVELNPLRARALVREARMTAEEYGRGKIGKKETAWVEETLKQLENLDQGVSRIYEVEGEVWLKLDLVRPSSYGEVMDLFEDRLVILDRRSDVVLEVGLNKSAGIVGGGELLSGARLVTLLGARGLVVADEGVVEIDLDKKTSAVVIEADEGWGEIVDMKAFGANLYLLDKSKGKGSVWKYAGVEGGFGARKRWFGAGVEPDLSQAVSMAIDGSIYILTATGKLVRYTQGNPDVFEVAGLDKEFAEPVAVYTDADSDKVYVLDKGNRRVVVLGKGGEYEAQYHWEGIGQVSDMVVSEKEGKILLLSGEKIYQISLKNF